MFQHQPEGALLEILWHRTSDPATPGQRLRTYIQEGIPMYAVHECLSQGAHVWRGAVALVCIYFTHTDSGGHDSMELDNMMVKVSQ